MLAFAHPNRFLVVKKNKSREKILCRGWKNKTEKMKTWILNFNFSKSKTRKLIFKWRKILADFRCLSVLNLSNSLNTQLKSLRFSPLSEQEIYTIGKTVRNGDFMIYLLDFISQIVWINRRRFVWRFQILSLEKCSQLIDLALVFNLAWNKTRQKLEILFSEM